jgi:hypothetical protein
LKNAFGDTPVFGYCKQSLFQRLHSKTTAWNRRVKNKKTPVKDILLQSGRTINFDGQQAGESKAGRKR